MPSVAFADRPPTACEMERLRLILSTFQDGSGQYVKNPRRKRKSRPEADVDLSPTRAATLPGWNDFERAVAVAFGGQHAEGRKDIFDVLIPDPERTGTYFGISCKMRLNQPGVASRSRTQFELSNSSGEFRDELGAKGIFPANYKDNAELTGTTLLEVLDTWKQDVSIEHGGNVDLSKSCYLALIWDRSGWYQLFWYSIALPDPRELTWSFPIVARKGVEKVARKLQGEDQMGTLIEWYGESGGQLKYYPRVEDAIWVSDRFQLEYLGDVEYGLLAKTKAYFPQSWPGNCK